MDLCGGESHAAEDDTPANTERVAGPALDGSCILDWIKLVGVLGKRAKLVFNAVIGDVERLRAACAMDHQRGAVVEVVVPMSQ
jgi:hypothetical protein